MQVKLSNEVLDILSNMEFEGTHAKLTGGQLDRKTYVQVNDALELLGGKWNKKAKAHIFPDEAQELIEAALLTGEVTDAKKGFQFFPTPTALALELVGLAEIQEGNTILEPSAGRGNIADVIREGFPNNPLSLVELWIDNVVTLEQKGYKVEHGDFLLYTGKHDRIIANPPFNKQQDIAHVDHMLDCLNPGGVLVTVMSPGITFRTDKRTEALRNRIKQLEHTITEAPDGAFAESGTNVRTIILKVRG